MTDPFESIGGGVFVNGGWLPKGHPDAQKAGQEPLAQPGAPHTMQTRQAAPASPKPGPDWVPTPDGLGWLPPNMSTVLQGKPNAPVTSGTPTLAGQEPHNMFTRSNVTAPQTGAVQTTAPVFAPLPDIRPPAASQTIAPPASTTTGINTAINPQDLSVIKSFFRSEPTQADQRSNDLFGRFLERSNQSLDPTSDPIVGKQVDAFRAEQDRAARQMFNQVAEGTNPYSTGELRGQQRMMAERAGQATAGFEADLVGRELQARRAEVSDALNSMRGMLSEEQQRGLQRELATLDAALRKYGTDVGAQTATRGQDIQRYGIDVNAAQDAAGREMQRYGIDTSTRTAREGHELQKYGIDVGAESDRLGRDMQRYGIDTNLLSDREARELQKYGIDSGLQESEAQRNLQKYGIDTQAMTSKEIAMLDAMLRRYGIDVGAQGDRDRLGYQIGQTENDSLLRLMGL
jgi:hypothetical protein